jgi:CRP/FNR family cyclic AMP-dependent transcriptional regulator
LDRAACEFVEQSAWGRCLSWRELSRVIDQMHDKRIEPGGHLVSVGTDADHWIGIMDGLLVQSVGDASGRVSTLTAVCRDVWFGEGSVMKKERWRYDVVAVSESRAALVPRQTFEWIRERSLPFNHYLTRLLNERLSLYMGLLASERLRSPDARMAGVLASLFDPALYPLRSPQIQMTQDELALLAGVSRQRANAALRKLETGGLLQLQRGGLTVLDVDGLRSYKSTG